MGAAASTQLATEFFEENRRTGCPPPIHLDMNMDTKKVTDEGVQLMPGGALIVPSMECPLHQIGNGKGVSGKLRAVDSSRHKSLEPSRLGSSSRSVNQKSRTQKVPEGKPLMKSVKEANEHPGETPALAKLEVNPDLKPLFMIEQEVKHHDHFKTLLSSPENILSSNSKSSESPVKLDNWIESRPQPENCTITPMITQASPSVVDQVNVACVNEARVPLVNETSHRPMVVPMEPPQTDDKINITPVFRDITMENAIPPADLPPAPDEPLLLSNKDRVTPNTPAVATEETWTHPAQQAFYSSMLRKGWIFKETDMASDNVTNMMKIHNANHELAWREVLKWEALHADECREPKLKSCSAFGTKYSPRAWVRSWLGYSLPFDRHDWIVDRNGKEVRYIIDYYDGGKFNSNFEFALLDVRPALDSFEALWDRLCVAVWRWTSESGSTGVPGGSTVSGTASVSEPLNIGERFGSKSTDTLKGQNPSQFMSYNLSDVEKEREKKNSVS